jgi:predicted nucleic acid-binding protein
VIVVDASILTSFILMEHGYEKITAYIRDSMSLDHILKEAGNAIWKAYIKGYIAERDASERFLNLIKLTRHVMKLINETELIGEAGEIAIKNKISLYDSLYIALALREKAKLLTLDSVQAEAAERCGVEVIRV